MQVLLLFPLLALCRGRQVVVAAGTVVLKVMEGQLSQISRLNTKVGESFGIFVDNLIQAFLFELISASDRPPDELIQIMQSGTQDCFGQVDVSSLVDDFTVDQLSYLGHAVVGWAVELKGFTGSGVVVADLFEGNADIDGLDESIRGKDS